MKYTSFYVKKFSKLAKQRTVLNMIRKYMISPQPLSEAVPLRYGIRQVTCFYYYYSMWSKTVLEALVRTISQEK